MEKHNKTTSPELCHFVKYSFSCHNPNKLLHVYFIISCSYTLTLPGAFISQTASAYTDILSVQYAEFGSGVLALCMGLAMALNNLVTGELYLLQN